MLARSNASSTHLGQQVGGVMVIKIVMKMVVVVVIMMVTGGESKFGSRVQR